MFKTVFNKSLILLAIAVMCNMAGLAQTDSKTESMNASAATEVSAGSETADLAAEWLANHYLCEPGGFVKVCRISEAGTHCI